MVKKKEMENFIMKIKLGQFKNDQFNGKGEVYDKNDKLIFNEDFKNGLKDGEGIYFAKNGEYYFGQFKEDKMNGYGKIFDVNNNIKYIGSFVNNKKEGRATKYR